MSEPFPDRVCADKGSPHFYNRYKKIGITLDGRVLLDVHEFCVSDGWVRRFKRNDRGFLEMEMRRVNNVIKRSPVFVEERGKVELYWR